jgi:hypothetical protein
MTTILKVLCPPNRVNSCSPPKSEPCENAGDRATNGSEGGLDTGFFLAYSVRNSIGTTPEDCSAQCSERGCSDQASDNIGECAYRSSFGSGNRSSPERTHYRFE